LSKEQLGLARFADDREWSTDQKMSALGERMKKVLSGVLPKRQYESLARMSRPLRSKTRDPLHRLKQEIKSGALSDPDLLELKNGINLTRKMDYERADIFLHVDSLIEHEARLHSCAKEPDTVEWIETTMRPGDVFYDVGANVGAYSLVAAKRFAGKVKVYAFEPAFLNFSQLCRNLALNNCQDAVFPLSVALSGRTTIGQFNYHDLVPGSALHTFGEAVDYTGQTFTPVFEQTMLSYRLDDLIDQFKIPKPTHIKIDVDGIEKAVLEGAQKTLLNPSLRTVIVELEAGQGEREITELLVNSGFKLDSQATRWTPGMLNCIFVRKSHERSLAQSHRRDVSA
jgi:FkbM family methyltransferase